MSERKKRALSGILAGSGGSLIIQIVTIIVTPLYLNLTSQELFGLWLTLAAILSWIKIGDMGLGMALTRRSVEAWENNDYLLLKRLAYGAMLSAFIFSISIATIGYLATELLLTFFDVSDSLESEFKNTYFILLAIAAIRPSLGVFGSIIDGKQHIAFLGIRNTVVSLTVTALTIVLLFQGFGVISFAYGLLFEALIMPVIDIIYLKYIDKNISFFPIHSSKNDILSLLNFGGPFQILKLTNLVSTNVDNIIIASFIGFASVPIYVFTGKLAFAFAIFVIGIIPSMLFPGTAQLFELNKLDKIKNIYLKLSNIAIRVGILLSVIYLFINEPFIGLWVGDLNFGGTKLTLIFAAWVILESYVRGITVIVYSSERLNGLAFISTIESIFNISLTIYLISSLGIFGAVMASVLCRLISVFYIPITINKLLEIESHKYLLAIIKGSILFSLPMIFLAVLAHLYLYYQEISLSLFNASLIAFILVIVNLISFEGIFLIRQRGVKWNNRFKSLINYHLSV